MLGISGKLWPVRWLLLIVGGGLCVAFVAGVMGGWTAAEQQALQDEKAAKVQAAPKR